jgi:hypothetical protein
MPRLNIVRTGKSLIISLMLALLASCGVSTEATNLEIQDVERTAYSGIQTARNVVVNDRASWESLWAEHKSSMTPQPAAPQIDFSARTVVAVFLGERPNGCYEVRIESVQQVAETVLVRYREISEAERPSDVVCTQAITYPAHIVTVLKTSYPFEFIKID